MTTIVGKTIAGCVITDLIGASVNSSVYRARHTKTGKRLAIRITAPIPDPDVRKQFEAELRAIQQLDHPGLVRVLTYDTFQKDAFYITMPILTGGTLQMRLKKQAAGELALPSLGELADFVERISAALDYIHQHNMVHCQLEPRNVLMDKSGKVFLADTGFARLYKIAFELSTTGAVVTSPYSAPEQWHGEKPVPATDVYSLGILAYHLLVGNPPFETDNLFKLMEMHLHDMFLPPHYVRSELPTALYQPFIRALAKDPEDRYDTAGEFAMMFRRAIAEHEGEPTGFFTTPLNADNPEQDQ